MRFSIGLGREDREWRRKFIYIFCLFVCFIGRFVCRGFRKCLLEIGVGIDKWVGRKIGGEWLYGFMKMGFERIGGYISWFVIELGVS